MKISVLIRILFFSTMFAYGNKNDDRFIFFIHNGFLEEHELNELHPKFGRAEYQEIIAEFKKSGLNVISEKETLMLMQEITQLELQTKLTV